jgi:hypothetical protein
MKKALKSKYKMTDLGELQWCLGMRVKRDRSLFKITLDQELYTESILSRFGMNDCKSISSPSQVGVHLTATVDQDSDDVEFMRDKPYREAVGCLMYLSISTRPDITASVCAVARYSAKPSREHWRAVQIIFRYLRGTTGICLTFQRTSNFVLDCFSDSDWGGNRDHRKSTTGYVCRAGGGCVSWASKTQATVALSSAEAEYMAAAAATQEVLWWRTILGELGLSVTEATIIHEDNQGCIAMSLTEGKHGRTKHIDIRYHFIKQHVQEGRICLKYCPTDQQLADILTKPLPRRVFERLRGLLLGM